MASRPTIFVSSTVYGIEILLDQIYAALRGFGYRVWASRLGTIPLDPRKSAYANCIAGVEECDLFLGIITGRYGSGIVPNQKKSITHLEMLRAIELRKPHWFLVHYDVTLARELLRQFRFAEDGVTPRRLHFEQTAVLQDIRVLDLYDSVIQSDVPISVRTANWAQQYRDNAEALTFVEAQFEDIVKVRKYLRGLRATAKVGKVSVRGVRHGRKSGKRHP